MQLWSLIGASWKSNISLNGLKSWHIGFSCIFVFCEHSSLANIVPSTMVMTPTIDVNDIISIKCKPAQIHYWHQWIRLWMKAFQSQREQKKWRISTRIFCLMRCCSSIIITCRKWFRSSIFAHCARSGVYLIYSNSKSFFGRQTNLYSPHASIVQSILNFVIRYEQS